ncbi:MAG: hypothetical protein GF363_09535, partial [Chitinivibrionales bacterium]|nr:hypothetical protein [Chitinivibrionales bacterium]
MICPFSGGMITSRDSFIADNRVFYRFEGYEVFFVGTLRIKTGWEAAFCYLPQHDLVLLPVPRGTFEKNSKGPNIGRMIRRALLPRRSIAEICARLKLVILNAFEDSCRYLQSRGNRTPTVLIGNSHFAHYALNEMSGYLRLKDKGLAQNARYHLLFEEPLGPVNELLDAPSHTLIRNKAKGKISAVAMKNDLLVTRVGDIFINEELRNRVARLAHSHCEKQFIETMNWLHAKAFPLCWFSLKADGRTCVNQTQALARIIISLRKKYPNLGLVFDSVSYPHCNQGPVNRMDVWGNNRNVRRMKTTVEDIIKRAGAKDIPVHDLTGSSLFHAVVAANRIDAFFCHCGTLQHKVGFFSLAPGIIHSNRKLLRSRWIETWSKGFVTDRDVRYLDWRGVRDIGLLPFNTSARM